MKTFLRKPLVIAFGILFLAVGWKVFLLIFDVFPFNADEAIVALMGKHILAGESSVFFYGQAYMGSLDAYLTAFGFSLFGVQVWVVRLVQVLLYAGTLLTTYFIGKAAFRSAGTGLLAMLLLAIPTVNVTLYTTVSLGGYGEALLIGNLILLVGFGILNRSEGEIPLKGLWWRVLLWFFLCGLGLWANALTLVYSFPMGIALLILFMRKWKTWGFGYSALLVGCGLFGFLAGSAPWWIFATQNGLTALITELTGSAVSVETASWIGRVGAHLVNLILLGIPVTLGFRPPWDATWLILILIPFVMVVWAVVFVQWLKNLRRRTSDYYLSFRILLGIVITLCTAFIVTSFGVDPSGRYFVPLAIPLSLMAAELVRNLRRYPKGRILIVLLLLVYYGLGTLDTASKVPPGITTQFSIETRVDERHFEELNAFLLEEGETRGYTNYWVAYPLAFLSNEDLIFVPQLPYHADLRYTPRDNRYPQYNDLVEQSPQVAYITALTPELDALLRQIFTEMEIQWKEKKIGDFVVFYHLSRKVTPDEIRGLSQ